MAALRGGLDRGDVEGRAHAVGDVGLLAVDDEAAVDALGPRGDRRDVRARARLGDGQRGDLLAGDGRREVAALLVLGAELPDRRAWRCRRARRSRRPGRPSRSGPSPRRRRRRAGSRRPRRRTPRGTSGRGSRRSPAGEDLVGEPARLLPLGGVRAQLRATKRRTDSRSASCSSVKGGSADTRRRPYCTPASRASSSVDGQHRRAGLPGPLGVRPARAALPGRSVRRHARAAAERCAGLLRAVDRLLRRHRATRTSRRSSSTTRRFSAAAAQLPLAALSPQATELLLGGGHRPAPSMVSLDQPEHTRGAATPRARSRRGGWPRWRARSAPRSSTCSTRSIRRTPSISSRR